MARTPTVTRESVPEREREAFDAFVAARGEIPTTGPGSVMLKWLTGIAIATVVLAIAGCAGEPAPTATAIPPTATAVPVPPRTMAPATVWQVSEDVDSITDQERVFFTSTASEHNLQVLFDAPTLIVRCAGGSADIAIHWGGQYMAAAGDAFKVERRWGNEPAGSDTLVESNNNLSTFYRHSGAFLDRVNDHFEVQYRVHDFENEVFYARFPVYGLDIEMAKHPELCG